MALQVSTYKRVFKHGNITLADPNPDMTPEQVMGFYSNQYPELTTSNVHGPVIEGEEARLHVQDHSRNQRLMDRKQQKRKSNGSFISK